MDAEGWAQRFSHKMRMQNTIFVIASISMSVTPFLLSLLAYLKEGVWVGQLPLSLWIPFEVTAPVFPFVYLGELWLFYTSTWILMGVEATLGGVTMLICLQFKVVAHNFLSMRFGESRANLQAMERAIRYHNRVLDLSTRISELFSVTLFLLFVTSSMVLCIFLFLIVNERDPFTRTQYIINSVCFWGFCSVYAYYGNELIENVSGWKGWWFLVT